MSLFSISGVKISGISAAVPTQVVSNYDYKWVSEKDRQSIVKNVGVENRRVAKKGTTTSDLCFVSAEKLIQTLNWDKKDINLLVFVSQSRDYLVPSTSAILQDRLGLSTDCVAFDIGLGCSGWVYGLSMITSMMNTSGIKKALLLVGDISTINLSYRDKSAYPLFGDAGTATALELDEHAEPMFFNLQTNGKGYKAIIMPDSGVRNFLTKKSFELKKIDTGIYRNQFHLALNGIEVFNFALSEVTPNANSLMKYANISKEEIDYFLFHQANKLINNAVRKMMKLDETKTPTSLTNFGNTSSASIPLTIVTNINKQMQEKENKLFASGFGVGLSWGSCIFTTKNISCPELIEFDTKL